MKTLNKKGFTLVELLAVIVILAIIILFALPAVIGTMETARAGTFKNEVNAVIADFQTAFSRETMMSSTEVKNVTVNGDAYRYMCMTLKQLYESGYSEKSQFAAANTKYAGYYQAFIPANGTASATYVIRFTNGQFTINDLWYSETSSDAYTPAFTPINDADWGTCPAVDNGKAFTEIPHKALTSAEQG